MLRFLLSEPRPSHMDFLRKCFGRAYSDEVTELLAQKLRTSSRNQCESTWKFFLNFIHTKRPSKLSEGIVLELFTYQFQQVGRKPAAIRTYKSALEQPLQLGFNINIQEKVFSALVRAMALLAPAERTPTISWSLNKVLSLLSSPDYSGPDISESKLLLKAIFLVMLADHESVKFPHSEEEIRTSL